MHKKQMEETETETQQEKKTILPLFYNYLLNRRMPWSELPHFRLYLKCLMNVLQF